jgi:hypothetical protein
MTPADLLSLLLLLLVIGAFDLAYWLVTSRRARRGKGLTSRPN